ncbi:AAA family ATPase [Capnocytophaga genosp. AHN8471]|uniref:AAA family ATPase n=1 Tax=Capnocytophaga genosp. AHN8471 TaxID=327574 RepID=UPI001931D36F|nr:AAA family ATPase [Capnocytophaga genosp. AHN8471]MBM0654712.1 AAA family ATPase [Capnocytophaga genosp. AHN8471]
MNGIATYDNITIPNLKKVNFFFGLNGSGKSTIAKYLNSLISKDESFNQCTNIGFDSSQDHIMTFNEEFIEENFKRNSELKGIFSLNQRNTTIDKQIRDKEEEKSLYERLINKYIDKKEKIEKYRTDKYNELIKESWDERKIFSTFNKINLAHAGSKENHLRDIKQILSQSFDALPIEDIKEQYNLLYEKEIKFVNTQINVNLYNKIQEIERKLNQLLDEVIIGKDDVPIADLIKKIDSRTWIQQGINLLEKTGNICPFCQQETINEDLIKQFNELFDDNYKKKITEIQNLYKSYREETSLLLSNLSSIQSEFNSDNIVSDLIIKLNSLFSSNYQIIETKINSANEKKIIGSISSEKDSFNSIYSKIRENNEVFNSLESSKKNFIRNIWLFMADNCREILNDYDKKIIKIEKIKNLATELEDGYKKKIDSIKEDISILREKTIDTKEAVNNINEILRNSGFTGFEIEEKEKVNNISRYYLKRNNIQNRDIVFNTLSEGEKHFISFLYFYQLCLGTDDLDNNTNKNKIIVIDDPVSSLDSQSLFVVSTLIRELIKRRAEEPKSEKKEFANQKISQVFLFTHNFYFYKEVSFSRRLICTDYWHYNVIKINNITQIKDGYNKTIEDDYSLLWNTLKESKKNINSSTNNIMISNTMRRILETYINFVGIGAEPWQIISNEDKSSSSYYIKSAFISIINEESHKVFLDTTYYHRITKEQPQILYDIFEDIFKVIGKSHYDQMMGEEIL